MTGSETRWSSSMSFVFAASAAAVGLGNIWRFPYIAGQNGGGAFVLVYLICVLILGIPLLIAEVAMGKTTRKEPHTAIQTLAQQNNRSRLWGYVGLLNIAASFLILCYYTVISGWVLDYLIKAVSGSFNHISEPQSQALFQDLMHSPIEMLLANSTMIAAMTAVGMLGIKNGLEKTVLWLFPLLVVLLFLLLGVAATSGQMAHGLHFLFYPNFSKINTHTILLAMGQAFFSLNIALGVTLLFGAYLPDKSRILPNVLGITIADTGIALLAGCVIFPIAFAHHLTPNSGPSLIFMTLPVAFNSLPYGQVFAVLFFLMLELAAFTSIISMIEPFTNWMLTKKISRRKSCLIAGGICWIISLGNIASFGPWKNLTLWGRNFYGWNDFITANIMLPIGGLLIALFCGWYLKKEQLATTLGWKTNCIAISLWRFSLRIIAPLAISLILLAALHII